MLKLKINKLTLKDKRLGDKIWMTDICGRDFIYGTFWQMARFSTDITWHQHKPRRVYNNFAWLNWISIELIFLHRQRVATKALNRFNIVQYKNDWCAPTMGAPRVMMIFVLSKTIGVFLHSKWWWWRMVNTLNGKCHNLVRNSNVICVLIKAVTCFV